MVWAGAPFSQLIEFKSGPPTSSISYTLTDQTGTVLINTTVTPDNGAASHLLVIPGSQNGCALPLFETRTLTWSYTTASAVVSDRISYMVDRPLPFPVTAAGVRNKLGVEPHELEDMAISLVRAYGLFLELLPDLDVEAVSEAGTVSSIICFDAVEALAAIECLPSLQLKIAQRETGGTNEYQRYGTIDWAKLEGSLAAYVDKARATFDSSFDGDAIEYTLFSLASRASDPLTGT